MTIPFFSNFLISIALVYADVYGCDVIWLGTTRDSCIESKIHSLHAVRECSTFERRPDQYINVKFPFYIIPRLDAACVFQSTGLDLNDVASCLDSDDPRKPCLSCAKCLEVKECMDALSNIADTRTRESHL